MSSTLGCIGLAVNDMDTLDELVGRVLPDAEVVAEAGGLQARRWVDPSGASLTMTVRQQGDDGGVLVDLVPSYVGPAGAGPGVRVGVLTPHGQTLAADLVDAQGETLTRIACDLAQSLVAEVAEPRPAHLIALGLDVSVHADEAAFTGVGRRQLRHRRGAGLRTLLGPGGGGCQGRRADGVRLRHRRWP